jgi:hypothetical protein
VHIYEEQEEPISVPLGDRTGHYRSMKSKSMVQSVKCDPDALNQKRDISKSFACLLEDLLSNQKHFDDTTNGRKSFLSASTKAPVQLDSWHEFSHIVEEMSCATPSAHFAI